MARVRKWKHFCDKKLHPFRVNWCWSCMWAGKPTSESPRWNYWDSKQCQRKTKIFLTAPELSKFVKNFSNQFYSGKSQSDIHHDLSPSKVRRDHSMITRIKKSIASHGNPFCVEGSSIYNLITHAYIPDEYVPQILNMDNLGQKLYEDYVSERINGSVSNWEPVKKEILCICLATITLWSRFGIRMLT